MIKKDLRKSPSSALSLLERAEDIARESDSKSVEIPSTPYLRFHDVPIMESIQQADHPGQWQLQELADNDLKVHTITIQPVWNQVTPTNLFLLENNRLMGEILEYPDTISNMIVDFFLPSLVRYKELQ